MQVGLTHNNLHVGCVFVGGADSKWKIGGFELSSKLKLSTKKVSAITRLFTAPKKRYSIFFTVLPIGVHH